MLQQIAGLTGVLFGEAQRWCYPENVPVETTLPNQHSHICQRREHLDYKRVLHLASTLEEVVKAQHTYLSYGS